jgi:hypothetical protein
MVISENKKSNILRIYENRKVTSRKKKLKDTIKILNGIENDQFDLRLVNLERKRENKFRFKILYN